MKKIIIDDKIPFVKGVLEPFFEVSYLPYSQITNESIKDVSCLIVRTRTKIDRALLHGTKVEFVISATIGIDHVNLDDLDDLDIEFKNCQGCNVNSVLQYIISSLVVLKEDFSLDYKNLTFGIIGCGHVGSKIYESLKSLNFNVLCNDPPRAREEGSENFVELDELILKADIISLHVPLIKEGIDKTLHLVDEDLLKKMKKNALLINTSRGEVIDNDALNKALIDKEILGCVLDVWESEPNINLELLMRTHLSTPHIAGYSVDGKAKGSAMAIEYVAKFFSLPFSSWFPSNLPEKDKELQGSFDEVVLQAYDIRKDNASLKLEPDKFESFRSDYPARRDFDYYQVKADNCSSLTSLNFQIKE